MMAWEINVSKVDTIKQIINKQTGHIYL